MKTKSPLARIRIGQHINYDGRPASVIKVVPAPSKGWPTTRVTMRFI